MLIKRVEDRIARYGSSKFVKNLIYTYILSYSNKDGLFRNKIPSLKMLFFFALKVDTDKSGKFDDIRGNGSFEPKVIFRLIEAVEILNDSRIDDKFSSLFFMNNPIEYLKQIIYFDSKYKETQYPHESVILLLRYIINDNLAIFNEKFEMLPGHFIEISQAIIRYATNEIEKCKNAKHSISPLDILKLIKHDSGIDLDIINSYFRKMMASKPLNEAYDHPLKMECITSASEWLIPIRDDNNLTCYLPLPSIQCFGLYDKTMNILDYPNIGITFENLVRKRLSDATNTEVYTGKYLYNNKVYESDGILILDELVILLECKTKPLQRESRSGNIGKAIFDLGLSFLKSAIQAYRCELSFRENSKIGVFDSSIGDNDIKKGIATPSYKLHLPKNAVFYRLSCTTFNYGTFIEKPVVKNLLSLFIEYTLNDKAIETGISTKNIADITKMSDELYMILEMLKPYYTKDKEDENDYLTKITFNTTFIPFGLLYMYTNNTSGDRKFKDKITLLLGLTSDEYDAYTSYTSFNEFFFNS